MTSRPLPDRQGDPACAIDLVAPLVPSTTEKRNTDDAGDLTRRARSCAVSQSSTRLGDVDSANYRSTLATATTPGTRTSTTATRTTPTRTTTTGRERSANQSGDHAEFSFADLVEAYFDCREHKRNTRSALHFEEDLERNLVTLYRELAGGTYRIGPSTVFPIFRPKLREVWAASFRDRIPQHLLYNRIAPRFHARFIADTCACIPGRGTLYAARRAEAHARSVTQNWARPAYYMNVSARGARMTLCFAVSRLPRGCGTCGGSHRGRTSSPQIARRRSARSSVQACMGRWIARDVTARRDGNDYTPVPAVMNSPRSAARGREARDRIWASVWARRTPPSGRARAGHSNPHVLRFPVCNALSISPFARVVGCAALVVSHGRRAFF